MQIRIFRKNLISELKFALWGGGIGRGCKFRDIGIGN